MNKFNANDFKFHSQSDLDKVIESSKSVKKSDLLQGKRNCKSGV